MTSHLEHREKLCKQVEILIPKAVKFEKHKFHGKYAMKCEAIQYDWPGLSKQLRL